MIYAFTYLAIGSIISCSMESQITHLSLACKSKHNVKVIKFTLIWLLVTMWVIFGPILFLANILKR